MQYMLDTNICIHISKRRPQQVLARFQNAQQGDVVMSAITYGELYFGAMNSSFPQTMTNLKTFASGVPVISLDEPVSKRYGELRAYLQQRGELIGANDLWIAAHCLHLGLTLVTNNEREFHRVPSLKIENWTK